MKPPYSTTGNVMTEYTVCLAVMATMLFVNVDGTPMYLQLANAIISCYQSFSAAISVPVTPI